MTEILKNKIQDSQKILLQCHKNPDPDSVGSALAWYEALTSLGKEAEIICPNNLSDGMKQLFPKAVEIVQQKVDFLNFDFSAFDLFLINDTASINQLANTKEFELPTNTDIFVVDHHKSNDLKVEDKIVEGGTFANAQILFKLFTELEYEITPTVATYMYAGMLTDTYNFLYAELDPKFFETLASVISKGANIKHVIDTLHMSNSLDKINAMGHIMNRIKVEGDTRKFAWVYFDHDEMSQFNISYHDLKDKLADEVINTIEGTDFGIVVYKLSPNSEEFYLSIRSRSESFDAARLAKKFGGGGHKSRAGASVSSENISQVIDTVTQFCDES